MDFGFKMRRGGRRILLASTVGLSVCGGLMSAGTAAEAVRSWHTDRVKLLDSPEMMASTARVLNGTLPGTNKPYDAQKVADDLVQIIFAELQDQSGVHAETALTALGALAGFSVQMGLRETLVKPGKAPEDKVFVIAKTKDGETFYLGDLANEGLFGGKPGVYSVYALVGGGAQKAGAKELPDVREIAGYVASTLGSDKFGIPRIAADHMPHARPIELLDKFWNPVRNYMVLNVQAPLQWPLVLALASQKVIVMGKDTLDPALGAKLVMETATAMAKIDPTRIHNAYFQ